MNVVERSPALSDELIVSKILLIKKSVVVGGNIESKKIKKSCLKLSTGMKGITAIMKRTNGKIAIKKLRVIELALVVSAPFIIPPKYNFNKSYKENSFKKESLIPFKNLTTIFPK
jgi:hypothetical protein